MRLCCTWHAPCNSKYTSTLHVQGHVRNTFSSIFATHATHIPCTTYAPYIPAFALHLHYTCPTTCSITCTSPVLLHVASMQQRVPSKRTAHSFYTCITHSLHSNATHSCSRSCFLMAVACAAGSWGWASSAPSSHRDAYRGGGHEQGGRRRGQPRTGAGQWRWQWEHPSWSRPGETLGDL